MKKIGLLMIFIVAVLSACTSNEREAGVIRRITYEGSTFGLIVDAVEVDFQNGTRKLYENDLVSRDKNPTDFDEIPQSDFTVSKIEDIPELEQDILDTGTCDWQEEYIDPDMMDGYQWMLNIYFQNDEVKSIYGSNSGPETFLELRALLSGKDTV
ncbi:hypothetical protein ACYSNU_09175 [Enterococcus sp. LJL120]